MRPPGGRPAVIAHGAGNTAARIHEAIGAHADYLEVDLWVSSDRFEARHERRAFDRLPLLFEQWYLKAAPSTPFGLAELLREVAGRAGVFLDLKNRGDAAAELVRRALREADGGARLIASSQSWSILRTLRGRCPQVDVYYSVDVRAQLDLFLSVIEHDATPAGVSCRHDLIDRSLVERLHARGLGVVAWTVDDPGRARELASWGVDALTTHAVAEIRDAVAS